MSIGPSEFVQRLVERVPEVRPILDERYRASRGRSGKCRTPRSCSIMTERECCGIRGRGQATKHFGAVTSGLAFFFHYLDVDASLMTPFGDVALPQVTERPRRLDAVVYEEP